MATLYFAVNDIEEDKQVSILLSSIGAQSYSLIRDLVAPKALRHLSLTQLLQVLTSHSLPKHLVIAERFHFHKRVQATDESISEFNAALRKLTLRCEFGEMLEEVLRDHFVYGLHVCHEATKRRLLSEAEFTYQRVLGIAKGMEAANSSTVSFKAKELVIHKVRKQIPHKTGKKPPITVEEPAIYRTSADSKIHIVMFVGKRTHRSGL